MSEKFPVINAKQLIKLLEKKGFKLSRQSGSHGIYTREDGTRVTVPIHGKKDLGKGLIKQIIGDAGITPEELRAWK